jgi:hypothetical protein
MAAPFRHFSPESDPDIATVTDDGDIGDGTEQSGRPPIEDPPCQRSGDGRFEVPAVRRAGRRTRTHMFTRKSPIKKSISDKHSSKGDEYSTCRLFDHSSFSSCLAT